MVGPTRYKRASKIEQEGIAETFVARRSNAFGIERMVRIKRIKRGHPGFGVGRVQLIDEARATARLCHPNVLSFLDLFEDGSGIYLLSEHVEGVDLGWVCEELTRRSARVESDLAASILIEVLNGLHHAHTAADDAGNGLGLVHRDLRPKNIRLTKTGHIKLTGFSMIRMSERVQPNTEPGLIKGWTPYLAPEYIAGESCTAGVDVYAAGVLLFELLTGAPCFDGEGTYEMMRTIINEGPDLSRLGKVPEALANIVARSTSFLPQRRFPSAAAMAAELEDWMDHQQRDPRRVVELVQGLSRKPAPAKPFVRMDSDPTDLLSSDPEQHSMFAI